MADYLEGHAYIQVRPHETGRGRLRVGRATQSLPDSLDGNSRVVKLVLRVPAAAFKPLAEALVIVPENLVQHSIHVEAVEP